MQRVCNLYLVWLTALITVPCILSHSRAAAHRFRSVPSTHVREGLDGLCALKPHRLLGGFAAAQVVRRRVFALRISSRIRRKEQALAAVKDMLLSLRGCSEVDGEGGRP